MLYSASIGYYDLYEVAYSYPKMISVYIIRITMILYGDMILNE